MNKSKPNITLLNQSDYQTSGLIHTLKKGFNELFRKRNSSNIRYITKLSQKSTYDELISVIVCTNRKPEYSKAVIDSLKSSDTNIPYEIIIVNNTNKSFVINDIEKKVKITDEPTLGLSKARNTGAKYAKGEYLIYIDDDALADKDLIKNISDSFKKHQDYVIIGGQILLHLPTPVPNVFLKGKESLWSAYTVPYKRFKRAKEQYEFPYGACFAIRHSYLDNVGGFPEDFGRCGNDYAGGEETALCMTAILNGLKVGIEPSVKVTHMVEKSRFSKDHILNTTAAGIITTYRLFQNGYMKSGWTVDYINERINLLKDEISKLIDKAVSQNTNKPNIDINNITDNYNFKSESEKIAFYKMCELYSFQKVLEMAKEEEEKCRF